MQAADREKAIIIGGGISGKLAARVLADFFREVIIIERDSELTEPLARKGARQGEHLHALLHAGQYGLEKLFPGITEKFHQHGAVKINSTKDLAWFHHGVWKLRYDGGYSTTLQSRPHLEWHIENYIKQIQNVTYLYGHTVKNFLYRKEENRIYGVEVYTHEGDRKTLTGNLIVDASGASSITTKFLNKMDIHIPSDKVQIGLCYVSKMVRLPEDSTRNWKIKLIYPNPPKESIGGTISTIENGQYIVTLIGYQNEIQEKINSLDHEAFLAIAKMLPKTDIYNELRTAESMSETSIFKVPYIVWKHFDQIKQLPKGILLIGDSICRIDPVFGQGMSIAVIEALELRNLLEKNNKLDLTQKFHKRAAKIISPIWNMVITEDFRYPSVSGKKPIGLSIQQWYSKNIFLLSSRNKEVYDSFIHVMNLVKTPLALMRPGIIKKVFVQTFSRK